ncbi:MAG: transposase [Chloroflexi bacterium]|nr:MAG: transposase [Chloroflexota bacterium]
MNRPNRKTIRLQNYDYAQGGAYFITICTWQREMLFGEITGGEMTLNPLGHIVQEEWQRTEQLRPYITLDQFIVMPNHVHGILFIVENQPNVGAQRAAPLHNTSQNPNVKSKSLGAIVRAFKSAATRRINRMNSTPGSPVWQRGYWDRIIRNGKELHNTRQYILNNPLNWTDDENHPQNFGK